VHEYWNNVTDKKYSRNLGTGNGIELVTIAAPAASAANTQARFARATTTEGEEDNAARLLGF
jgi:hypothetical protein